MATESKHILITDDDSSLRQLMEILLCAEGYQVTLADNGATALQLASEHNYDLILLDLMMPVMDGRAFLQNFYAEPQNTPVIMLTAMDDPEKIQELRQNGAHGVLNKPIEIDQFTDQIRAFLER